MALLGRNKAAAPPEREQGWLQNAFQRAEHTAPPPPRDDEAHVDAEPQPDGDVDETWLADYVRWLNIAVSAHDDAMARRKLAHDTAVNKLILEHQAVTTKLLAKRDHYAAKRDNAIRDLAERMTALGMTPEMLYPSSESAPNEAN
jgi:hypothetical protein